MFRDFNISEVDPLKVVGQSFKGLRPRVDNQVFNESIKMAIDGAVTLLKLTSVVNKTASNYCVQQATVSDCAESQKNNKEKHKANLA
ncbi:hypothetical protein J6590_072809 [Homalodisca vitripennis]|nr:hypothetical protein J6590_072809 [Homalodisca vitripennis]